MIRIPESVLKFSAGDKHIEPYKMFYDYWNHFQANKGKEGLEYQVLRADGTKISFAEKEEQMNAALKREILRVSGITGVDEFPLVQLSTHPTFKWACFAVVSAMIDMIMPDFVNDAFSSFAEIRNLGWGDSAIWRIKPRDIFTISKHGRDIRKTEVHKQFIGEKTLIPDPYQLTVGGISLYKVLTGMESLADLVTKMIESFDVAINEDIYDAFETAMLALPSTEATGLYASGYTQDELTRLCENVSAWNRAEAVIFGTKRALANILPNDANYRYYLTDDFVKNGYIGNAFGYRVFALTQMADYSTPFGTKLSNSYLYILSPGAQKFVKVVLEGSTLANATDHWENADLTQDATLIKSWGVGVITSAVAGCIALS